jgi:hypothetical protein
MQQHGVGTGADDAGEADPLRPAPPERVFDESLKFVLVHAGPEGGHCVALGVGGETDGLAQSGQLVVILDQPQRRQLLGQVADLNFTSRGSDDRVAQEW